jgi:hypothetical protein
MSLSNDDQKWHHNKPRMTQNMKLVFFILVVSRSHKQVEVLLKVVDSSKSSRLERIINSKKKYYFEVLFSEK